MVEIKINGEKFEAPAHYTLLQALEEFGIEVPRFCFHERLSIAGNCRMCLIEVKGGPPKPVASCGMNVSDLRPGPDGASPEIFTNTPMVEKARQGVMEFLLLNHPLDCPLCDQGGECDLQDQAMAFGADTSRYLENKRAVEDKYIGPLIATAMTRCIHCTRCVRFMTEIAGVSELGMVGRGEDAAITTFLEHSISSELQGNIIDLCPVGALTARPHAFKARSWELSATETVDVMDAVGSAVRVESRGCEVVRILPRLKEDLNEEWISDKTRFICDGLKNQRLDRPFVRADDGRLHPASWSQAFEKIKSVIEKTTHINIGALAGDLACVEAMYAVKILLQNLGCSNFDCRQDGAKLDPSYGRSTYIFNPTIKGIEKADALLILGSNPRFEAPLLNARIRKRWRKGNFPIGVIGEKANLLYSYDFLGNSIDSLKDLAAEKGDFFYHLKQAKNPLILIGQGALSCPDGQAILSLAAKIACLVDAVRDDWNGFGVLHNAAARVGGLDIGFTPSQGAKSMDEMLSSCDVLFLLGADEIKNERIADKSFVIYIGTHGDSGAQRADVILPGCAYTEKSATYVNTEGRVQCTRAVVAPPGDAKEDWFIFSELSDALGCKIAFDSLKDLRAHLYAAYPHLSDIDSFGVSDVESVKKLATLGGSIGSYSLSSPVKDFYLTNPIARSSPTMAECSRQKDAMKKNTKDKG